MLTTCATTWRWIVVIMWRLVRYRRATGSEQNNQYWCIKLCGRYISARSGQCRPLCYSTIIAIIVGYIIKFKIPIWYPVIFTDVSLERGELKRQSSSWYPLQKKELNVELIIVFKPWWRTGPTDAVNSAIRIEFKFTRPPSPDNGLMP